MNNRGKLFQRLQSVTSSFQAELDYYMWDETIREDENYDLIEAFEDLQRLIEQESKHNPIWKEYCTILREVGYAIPIDLSQHTVMGGSKERLIMFRHNKQPYTCITSWESWINQ